MRSTIAAAVITVAFGGPADADRLSAETDALVERPAPTPHEDPQVMRHAPTPGPTLGPEFAVGLAYTVGHGGTVQALDLGWRLEAGLFLRVGRLQATVSAPWHPEITSSDPHRDGNALSGIGVSSRLAYHLPIGGVGILLLGAGIERRWISGVGMVERGCRQTGACIAGTYQEQPSYHAWAPQLRVGIGPEKPLPDMIVGATFELIVEAIDLRDVPPAGIRALAVTGALTFVIGGGPRR